MLDTQCIPEPPDDVHGQVEVKTRKVVQITLITLFTVFSVPDEGHER